MGSLRACFAALMVLASFSAFAQNWQGAYEEGLKAARQGHWANAREAFMLANKARPGDAAAATNIPGPPTERRQWRNGSPYSPRFIAAYSAYRMGLETADEELRKAFFVSAASELQALVDANEAGVETFYYLSVLYGRLGDTEKKKALDAQYQASKSANSWRVDTEVVAPEDMSLIKPSNGAAQPLGPGSGSSTTTITAGSPIPTTPGAVATIDTKFALVIGNSEAAGLPFAANDAKRVREALLLHAGYPEANVVLLQNVNAEQMRTAANELGARIPQEATVLIYFAGRGTHSEGHDYLAGADKGEPIQSMLPKVDLFKPFVAKGARIFSYFEAARPVQDDQFFGREIPAVGAISQMQATMPGGVVGRLIRDGVETGVFTEAFCRVLSEMRSNQIPVMEFGWQVFYKVRRGDTGSTGGGSQQTPTLPVLSNLAADARF
ncbi:MAG: caspase family protein [Fimbriimonas sp.]